MKTNHNESIPEATVSDLEGTLSKLLKVLAPYATPLTSGDRHNLLKTGPKTFEFVELAHTVALKNPELLSRSFNMEAFTADWNDTHNLLGLVTIARQITETLDDIRMAAGSEAQRSALEVYAEVKAAAARNVPDARAVYEQLKAAYPIKHRKRRGKDTPESPEQA